MPRRLLGHVEIVQGGGIQDQQFWSSLHHHVVLVDVLVDGRDVALAECVVEGVVDRRVGEAEPRRGGAVVMDASRRAPGPAGRSLTSVMSGRPPAVPCSILRASRWSVDRAWALRGCTDTVRWLTRPPTRRSCDGLQVQRWRRPRLRALRLQARELFRSAVTVPAARAASA